MEFTQSMRRAYSTSIISMLIGFIHQQGHQKNGLNQFRAFICVCVHVCMCADFRQKRMSRF